MNKRLGLICVLSVLLVGCHKTDTIEIQKINETNQEIYSDLLVKETLSDNDSGVSNPNNNFVDLFLSEETIDVKSLEEDGVILEDVNDDSSDNLNPILAEYLSSNQLSEELYFRLKEEIDIKDFDFDHDGLTDYEEIEVYHSNPNLLSTSGDFYTDKYKVDNNMDLFTKYDMEWQKSSNFDDLYYLPGNAYSFLSKTPEIWENYLDDSSQFVVYVGFDFVGDIKFITNIPNDYKVEVLNTFDKTSAEIKAEYGEDYILIHTDKGYDKYLFTLIK